MLEKDEEGGELICQERHLNLQSHSQMMNDRKQTDLEEFKYAKAPARLQQEGIYNPYNDAP